MAAAAARLTPERGERICRARRNERGMVHGAANNRLPTRVQSKVSGRVPSRFNRVGTALSHSARAVRTADAGRDARAGSGAVRTLRDHCRGINQSISPVLTLYLEPPHALRALCHARSFAPPAHQPRSGATERAGGDQPTRTVIIPDSGIN